MSTVVCIVGGAGFLGLIDSVRSLSASGHEIKCISLDCDLGVETVSKLFYARATMPSYVAGCAGDIDDRRIDLDGKQRLYDELSNALVHFGATPIEVMDSRDLRQEVQCALEAIGRGFNDVRVCYPGRITDQEDADLFAFGRLRKRKNGSLLDRWTEESGERVASGSDRVDKANATGPSMRLFGLNKPLVGLDIGSSAAKAVELAKSGKTYRLREGAIEAMGTDAIANGAVVDFSTVADNIRPASKADRSTKFSEALRSNQVFLLASNDESIVLPVISGASTAFFQFDAEHYIPSQISEVNLEHPMTGAVVEVGDDLLTVAKQDKGFNRANSTRIPVQSPDAVAIDAFALYNISEVNYSVDPDATTALFNIGAPLMNTHIVHNGMPLFIRDVSIIAWQKTFDIFREIYPSEAISAVIPSGAATSQVHASAEKTRDVFGYCSERKTWQKTFRVESYLAGTPSENQFVPADSLLASGIRRFALEKGARDRPKNRDEAFGGGWPS